MQEGWSSPRDPDLPLYLLLSVLTGSAPFPAFLLYTVGIRKSGMELVAFLSAAASTSLGSALLLRGRIC